MSIRWTLALFAEPNEPPFNLIVRIRVKVIVLVVKVVRKRVRVDLINCFAPSHFVKKASQS